MARKTRSDNDLTSVVAVDATPDQADLLPRAARVAARLNAELKNLVTDLPPDARGGSALARRLRIDRATCQRVLTATRAEGVDVLSGVPGVQGLAMFIKALEQNGADKAKLAAAEVAVEQYDALIRDAGGSRAELLRRLDEAQPNAAADVMQDDRDARERLFTAARELVGRWSHVSASTYIYRPLPDDPTRMQSVSVTGLIGHRARADAVPLTVTVGSMSIAGEPTDPGVFKSIDESPVLGHTPSALLEPFCTRPVPLVTSRIPGKDLVQIVDSTTIDPARGADIVIGRRPGSSAPHPATETPPIHEVWVLMNYPARHLLLDVYMHRSMARQCIPSASNHLWTLGLDEAVGRRWSTRFPRAPRLEILGEGPAPAAAYARQPELAEYLFDQVGWSRDEFVAYRCAVEFPMWRVGYCLSFDFSEDEDD